MVVVIPSYNNERWVEKNLTSVLTQKYNNFRVVYIDDCSTDTTYKRVLELVEKYQQQERVTVIHNETRRGALANLYTTIHEIEDNAIVVTVDGDDWLPRVEVLAYLNKLYTEKDIWLTYGQFMEYPSGALCTDYSLDFSEEVIRNNTFRKVEHLPISHLRTFYAWLFKSIKLKDCLYEGDFYSMTWDKVMMAPMIEMSAHRFYCVPNVLYVYNNSNPISDHRVNFELQASLALYVLGLPPYEPITMQRNFDVCDDLDKATGVLLCRHQPNSELIMNLLQNIHLSGSLYVLYPSDTGVTLAEDIRSVVFVPYNTSNLIQKLHDFIKISNHRYVLLCSDSICLNHEVALEVCIHALKNTQADLFYCAIGSKSDQNYFTKCLPLVENSHSIHAWYAQNKNDSWHIPVISMSLWPCDLFLEVIAQCSAQNIEDLHDYIEVNVKEKNRLGLMFAENLCEESNIRIGKS
jgi:hypothetical protein